MNRFRNLVILGILMMVVLGWSAAALGATITGAVTNSTGQTGRIYLQVWWNNGGAGNWGVSIPSAGSYTIQGMPDSGVYQVFGYVDKNGDGVPNISEGYGWSNAVTITSGTVSGPANITLNPQLPADVVPMPLNFLEAVAGDGGVVLMWDSPQDDATDIFTQADSFRIEWSTNNFSTILGSRVIAAGSGADNESFFMVAPLTNNSLYYFRVISIVNGQEAESAVVSATPAVPVGGYTISGTISLPLDVSVPANTPIIPVVEGLSGSSFFMRAIPSFANGTVFSVGGIPSGLYYLYGVVDMNLDNRPSAGDYWANPVQVTVNGANVTGQTLTIAKPNALVSMEIGHLYNADNTSQIFEVSCYVESIAKRPVNVRVSGPQYPAGGVDLAWDVDDGGEFSYWARVATRPALNDQYSFAITYADDTSETLYAYPSAVYDSPVPNDITPSGTITSMPASITWTPSSALPAGWVVDVDIWGWDQPFSWSSEDADVEISGNSVDYNGPPLEPGNYTVRVKFCEDWTWNCVGREQTITVGPATIATLTPNDPSPSVTGTAVTFTAGASGGSGSYEYRFWVLPPGGTWTMMQDYSQTNTWAWTTSGLVAGDYTLAVHVRNTGSAAAYDAYATQVYTLTALPVPTAVSLTPNDPSPSVTGTSVTFTAGASGGSGLYEYKFWVLSPGGTWTMTRDYAQTATWTWATAGLAAGDYTVAVHARNAGSTAAYETSVVQTYVLTALPVPTTVTLVPDDASPSLPGTAVTFTAGASGGSGAYEYKFWVLPPGGAWTMMRDYAQTATWAWTTSGLAAGTYTVAVHARNAGSTAAYETSAVQDYVLTALPVPTAVTLVPDDASPSLAGTAVTFTAGASGGSGAYEYKFWVLPPGGAWTVTRDYAQTATWAWTTSGLAAGTYTVAVHARNAGSTAAYETSAVQNYTLTVLPVPTAATLRPATVTFAGGASGGTGSYEYRFWILPPGGAWTMTRDYATSNSWTWTTTGLAAGTYQIAIHVRNAGSSAGYETYSTQTLVLQ